MNMVAILIISGLFTIACSKGGSGGGGNNQSFDTSPKGFVATGATKPELAEKYSSNCAVAGQSTPTYQIDSRLAVGQVFARSFKESDFAGFTSATWTETITAVTANSVSSQIRVSGKVNLPTVPVLINQTCNRTGPDENGQYDWNCDERLSLAKSLTSSDCSIETSETDTYTSEITPGIYLGRKAYWTSQAMTGEIICDGKSLGRGSSIWNFVDSNELPSTDIYGCGGVSLFFGGEMKLESGKVISAHAVTVSKAPLVSE
jgi:hypothetical protein